jgi:hypothetical protein
MSLLLRHQIEKIMPLTDSEFDYILSHFTLKSYKKHQFLIQEGNAVPFDFFVLQRGVGEEMLKVLHR